MKDGQPFMITGSPGGDDQIMRTMQTLLNVIDFGMNVQEAIEAPRWSTSAFPASSCPHTMRPGDVERRVAHPGGRAGGAESQGTSADGGRTVVARIECGDLDRSSKTGMLKAGADPRVDAYAWAR